MDEKLARECAVQIWGKPNCLESELPQYEAEISRISNLLAAYGEAVAARNAPLNRNTLAKAIWDSEIAEDNFRGNKKDWAQWPDNFEKQPYCRRSTLRQADFILERLRSEAEAVAVRKETPNCTRCDRPMTPTFTCNPCIDDIAREVTAEIKSYETRFDEFDDANHPANKWWQEHGQYMMSGGGRREFIWACRGWIAREQLGFGKEVTGETEAVAGPLREQIEEAKNG